MKRWRPILVPVLFFLLGSLCGGTLMSLLLVRKVHRLIEAGPGDVVAAGSELVARRLDLDAHQREAFAPIVADLENGFRKLHLQVLPETRRLILDAESRLRPQLRPEQQAKLDAMLAGPRARWERFVPETTTTDTAAENAR